MEANLVKRKDRWDLYNEDGHKIASTLGGCNIKLSLKNCEAITNGYDLDELVKSKYPNAYNEDFEYDSEAEMLRDEYKSRGFYEGAKAIIEILGDKKFSEDDVREAIEIARNGSMQEQHNGYGRPTELRFVLDNLPSDKIIQSLQQTEWDCIIEMKEIQEIYRDGTTKYERVPKLDADGCIVLKRK